MSQQNPLIQNLEQMLARGEDNAVLRFGLGNAYLQQKDYQKASEHLAQALNHDKDYTAAWKLYGKALTRLDQLEKAHSAYQNGIKIAEQKGDKQAAKEMQVFLKKLTK